MDAGRGAKVLVAAVVMGGVLGACGQTGPLFLPEQKLEEIKRKKEEREQSDEQQREAGSETQSHWRSGDDAARHHRV